MSDPKPLADKSIRGVRTSDPAGAVSRPGATRVDAS